MAWVVPGKARPGRDGLPGHYDMVTLLPQSNQIQSKPFNWAAKKMEPSFSDSAHLRLSSSTASRRYFNPRRSPFIEPERRRHDGHPGLLVISAKRGRRSSKDLLVLPLKEPNQSLSRILREEAAILNIELKAGSAKHKNLWPKAVLEALDDAVSKNQWDSALKIFGLLRKQRWYQPKSQTYARLLTMLGKCRQTEQARSLFQIMLSEGLKPTLDVYTSLVGAYGHGGFLDRALTVIDEMKTISDCKPDAYTYTILINCCSKMRRFDQIPTLLAEMSYLGIECNTVTYNAMIDGYGKAGKLEEMESSLSNMLDTGSCLPDVVTMNSIIWAYGNNGKIIKMEKWYDEFQHMGVEPDVTTFNILVKSYGKAAMYEKMGSVMNYMKERFFSPTTVTFNIIIECFGKVQNVEKMEYYFRLMKVQGVKPNPITYCSLVSAYSKAGVLDKVPAMIRQIENSDIVLDTVFFNCVINAYGQAGDINIMEEMFILMKERNCNPDSITFATMVQAYRRMGMGEAAQNLERQMTNILEPG